VAKKIAKISNKPKDVVAKNKKLILQIFGGIIAAFIIFEIGFYIGNGRVSFGNGRLISINLSSNQGLPSSLNYGVVQQEYNILKYNFDGKLTTQQLQDGMMNGLVNSAGDPFTEYFNPSDAKIFNDELNNTFSGIGAELTQNSKQQTLVLSPLKGYPAANAGLKAQDQILTVNGKATAGQSVDTIVDEIRGPSGSYVTLVVNRNGQQMTFKIKRETITAPSVQWSILSGNIGYMQITTFANDTPKLSEQAANYFKQQGVKSVILDLRDNPGGLVTSAVSVSSLWLPGGSTIMIEKHSNQVVQTYTATGNDILQGIPTVVLIDGGSASASEITAGALSDNQAAVTMGQQSYGKGTAQQIFPLSNGGELKVTIVHWFTPDNVSIEHKGITPQIKVTESSTDKANNVDTVKNAAINYLQTH